VISLKKILTIATILLLSIAKVNAEVKDSLFATIGNKAVTQFDIINEIKVILILTGQSFSEENKAQLQSAAIQNIIKKNIQQIEIDKYNSLRFSEKDLNMELTNLAKNIGRDLNGLEKIFSDQGVDFSFLADSIKAKLLWNSLIFKIYGNRLSINFQEIEDQLKLIETTKEINEYLLSEIIIRPVSTGDLNSAIKELKNRINDEGFKNVALNSSISSTAMKGGDLGWVDENILPTKFRPTIIKTSVGNISDPIVLPNGVLLFKVRDKRKMKKIVNLEDAKNQLVNAEKTKILNMHSLSHYENLKRSIAINYY
jgi:peptidyl-prolyl cis-trans isomerase SurA